jgi:hypothetical protein
MVVSSELMVVSSELMVVSSELMVVSSELMVPFHINDVRVYQGEVILQNVNF